MTLLGEVIKFMCSCFALLLCRYCFLLAQPHKQEAVFEQEQSKLVMSIWTQPHHQAGRDFAAVKYAWLCNDKLLWNMCKVLWVMQDLT